VSTAADCHSVEPAPEAPLREKTADTGVDALIKDPGRRAARATWYPPLSTAVWVLGQLRDYVQPAIFEDIAQEALHLCRTALSSGAEVLAARTTRLDGALFAVRHLLVLKELAAGLDLAQRAESAALLSPTGLTGGMTGEPIVIHGLI
jgi:hypothetical protein